ncbi:MAG: chromosomal replication initiator protein DnaA [Acidobacteria bacterium]|nr:chromosomal replication initiator protein DnaA [Acidobacteriota bacterium]
MPATDAQSLWETLRSGLAERLSESSFRDWVQPCRPLSFDGSTLWVQVPSPSARIWIEQQLAEEFNDTLVQADLGHLRLAFSVEEAPGAPRPARRGAAARAAKGEGPADFPQLFHRYTLDRFVVGPGSQLAFAAAKAVVDNHGKANAGFNMNPLFVYGGAGLGKTHLMIGIGKALKARHPDLAVCYLKVDSFFHELTGAIKNRNTEPLRRKYQQNDVLLLDDVQTLRSMERTQEEVFYILEYLLQNGRQIVITSDNPPQKLEGLHERLITRCKWGLTADIQPPDFETRIAILKKKLEDEFRELPPVPEEVLSFIAHKAKGSVRDLEGLLTRVVFQADFLGVPLGLEVAQVAYQGVSGQDAAAPVSMERVFRAAAENFGLTLPDLLRKKSRQASILLPRQVAMFLARELTAASFTEIGRAFNNMHHSTVMNAIDSVRLRMRRDPDFHKSVHALLNSIH